MDIIKPSLRSLGKSGRVWQDFNRWCQILQQLQYLLVRGFGMGKRSNLVRQRRQSLKLLARWCRERKGLHRMDRGPPRKPQRLQRQGWNHLSGGKSKMHRELPRPNRNLRELFRRQSVQQWSVSMPRRHHRLQRSMRNGCSLRRLH